MGTLRKYTVLILTCLFWGQTLYAQLSLKVRGSYNIPRAENIIELRNTVDTNLFATREPIFTTLGGGGTFGFDLGYALDDHFSAEIGFQYLHSTKEEALVSDNPFNQIRAVAYTRQGQVTIGGKATTGATPFSVYGTFGLVVPVFGVTTLDLDFVSKTFNADQFTRTENEGKFSVGFYGGLGVEYALTNQWGISLETRLTNLRIKIQRATVVESLDRFNGVDLLPTTPVSNIITEYRDALDLSSNNPSVNPDFSNTKPLEELSYTSNYSNLAFQLGFSYSLGR